MNRLLPLLTLLLPAPALAQVDEEVVDDIDALVQPLIDNDLYVGVSIGLCKRDDVVFRGYGRVSRDKGRAPDEQTVYEIGSISKTFTGVLLADAVLEGRMALEDAITEHLPAGIDAPRGSSRPIQLVDLATHTSGLPRLPTNWAPADAENPYADFTVDLLYAFLKSGYALPREPGETYAYSNLGAGILGHTVERAFDVPFAELMVTRICDPLGLDDTRAGCNESMAERLAPAYTADGARTQGWDFPTFPGIGGIRSTAADMMKWALANRDPVDTPLAKQMKLSHKRQHTIAPTTQGVALCWHIAGDGTTLVHSGQTGGYSSYVACNPVLDIAVVVLTNTATDLTPVLGERMVQRLAGMKVAPLPTRKAIEVDRAVLARYPGKYRLLPNVEFDITLRDEGLYAQLTNQGALRIYPTSETDFFYRTVDAQITFVMDDDGAAKALILHQFGRDQRAARVE